ncbi:transcriptional regulator with XRE-family HTH domain [Kibdelosporangium banguiense]|uniref:Transcriptional regulator with XRE-family HTH domain n=1 Tax=Kibdelosporangium banguiense TaxID=1365924 RepID=A0ABS4TPI6_9PSEU|nr:helix-turn-helix transcriptional regulator [Kibdelosporangium banguiense]MBP2326312.1 transcriptional regulator with XRE-family HTH domain [Kibdelosporangium banguiense]
MSTADPTSAYRELGRLLLRIREDAGLTAAQLAHGLEWAPTMISRMENGRRMTTTTDVVQYVVKCGLTLREARPLVELCRIAERKQGYYLSDKRIGGSLQSLIFLESSASHSIIYEPQVVNGLLQTPRYTEALIAAIDDLDEDWVASVVRTRRERQRILYLRNPARFTFYLHEQALRMPVGSEVTMHEQLLHFVLTAALENVTVRIVPIKAGARSVFGGAFRLMEFDEYRPVVYLDDLGGGGLILEDSDYVRHYYERMTMLADIALDEGQSRECVAELADAYDRGSQEVVADVLAQEQL